nr:hypothetical protein [Bathymodiolus platifrons methanotrophic gill symbiont]
MTSSQITLLIFICAFISAFFYFDLGHYLTLETLKAQQSVIENYRAANPKLAVVFLCADLYCCHRIIFTWSHYFNFSRWRCVWRVMGDLNCFFCL